jgi:hypothetical protein
LKTLSGSPSPIGRHTLSRSQFLPPSSSSQSRAFSWGRLNITYNPSRPTAIFTAGAPGSGKTWVVHQLFGGLDSLHHLDLDCVMRGHRDYASLSSCAELYSRESAYNWADGEVERRFAAALAAGGGVAGAENRTTTICLDGTGTNVDRTKRRMRMAKESGFWVVAVYVKVSRDKCVERNAKRERRVPVKTIEDYLAVLDDSVRGYVYSGEGLVDEFIACDNEEDKGEHEEERWGESWDTVLSSNETNRRLFDRAVVGDGGHGERIEKRK